MSGPGTGGDNTLVAEPENADVAPLSSLEGAGMASSWADLATAATAEDPDGMEQAFALAGAGLDTLGAITDPFDEFLSSGAGWLIEHIPFLHEALDALAGDPQQVKAQAQTWSNVAGELRSVAADHAAGPVHGWGGPAGTAYRGAVGDYGQTLRDVAGQADQVASLVLGSGVAVGTVRALVRDLIADFLCWAVKWAIAGVATITGTAGLSTPVVISAVAVEACQLASHIAQRIARLIEELTHAEGVVDRLVGDMRYAATELRDAAPYMHRSLEKVPAEEFTEAGKQASTAELDDRPVEQPLPR